MVILNKSKLKDFESKYRIWQGIPSIEVTDFGRIFVTFYSGGIKEEFGNYCLLYYSDDNGDTFALYACAYFGQDKRAYDPSLWIDPHGRLWWTYSVAPTGKMITSLFINIDKDIKYAGDIYPGYEVMMNKPIITSWGEWLLPCYVFDKNCIWSPIITSKRKDRRCFIFSSLDNGDTFKLKGAFKPYNRSFDEVVILEHNDHHLSCFTRLRKGIAHFESYDRGNTWVEDKNHDFKSPSSRFQFVKLKSGRILQINHYNFKDRNNLYALLSEDDGKTFPHKLLLDERKYVSYPDVKEAKDGFIYIVYDRERGAFQKCLKDAMKDAREILLAKITEEDIINGTLVNKNSILKKVISKLGEYEGNEEYLYKLDDIADNPSELVKSSDKDTIIDIIFNRHASCMTMLTLEEKHEVDDLINKIQDKNSYDDIPTLIENVDKLIRLLKRRSWDEITPSNPIEIVSRIKTFIVENIHEHEINLELIANKLNFSKYYILHIFKEQTGLSIFEYINQKKLKIVKELLLTTNLKYYEIGEKVGFTDQVYFSYWFKKHEGKSMKTYCLLNKKEKNNE